MTGESLYPRDLIERLRAELDRLEAVALAATRNEWRVDHWCNERGTDHLVVADFDAGPPAFAIKNEADAAHIAAHDPAHALRTIQAHRKILDCYHDVTERLAHWKREGDERLAAWARVEVDTLRWAIEQVASIYFPESDAADG